MNDQHKNSANITDQASKDDTDTPTNQIAILTESLVLAKMQEQAGFVKHIIGSATEDAWNNTNAFMNSKMLQQLAKNKFVSVIPAGIAGIQTTRTY